MGSTPIIGTSENAILLGESVRNRDLGLRSVADGHAQKHRLFVTTALKFFDRWIKTGRAVLWFYAPCTARGALQILP
jgi:hypothetical protein